MAERPEDLNLPNTVVARIIKEALPDGVNVSRDARLAISKSASIFVLYATSCANNFALRGKRKTITGNDVLDAMTEMEFERFVDPLKKALQAYKKGKFEAKKKKPETGGETEVIIEDDEEGNEAEEENGEEDGEEEEEENDGNTEDAEVVEVSD